MLLRRGEAKRLSPCSDRSRTAPVRLVLRRGHHPDGAVWAELDALERRSTPGARGPPRQTPAHSHGDIAVGVPKGQARPAKAAEDSAIRAVEHQSASPDGGGQVKSSALRSVVTYQDKRVRPHFRLHGRLGRCRGWSHDTDRQDPAEERRDERKDTRQEDRSPHDRDHPFCYALSWVARWDGSARGGSRQQPGVKFLSSVWSAGSGPVEPWIHRGSGPLQGIGHDTARALASSRNLATKARPAARPRWHRRGELHDAEPIVPVPSTGDSGGRSAKQAVGSATKRRLPNERVMESRRERVSCARPIRGRSRPYTQRAIRRPRSSLGAQPPRAAGCSTGPVERRLPHGGG